MKSVRNISSIPSGNSWKNKIAIVLIASKYPHLPIVLNITVIQLIANQKDPLKQYIYTHSNNM